LFGAADIVFVKGIAAINNYVAGLQQITEALHRLLGDLAGRQHDPYRARLFAEHLRHVFQRAGSGGAFFRQHLARLGVGVENDAAMSRLHQAAGHVAAHAA
jgi:hypothetical protein